MAITRAKDTEQPGFEGVFAAVARALAERPRATRRQAARRTRIVGATGCQPPHFARGFTCAGDAWRGRDQARRPARSCGAQTSRCWGDFFAFTAHHHDSLVDDVMQARIAIECQSIRLACSRATMTDLERLRAAVAGIAATIDDPVGWRHGGPFLSRRARHRSSLGDPVHAVQRHRQPAAPFAPKPAANRSSATNDGRSYLIDHHRLVFEALAAAEPRRADEVLREHFAIGDDYRRRDVATGPRPKPQGITP